MAGATDNDTGGVGMERLEGRTAFVTGAASGIGLAIAEVLLTAGARVVLADRDADALERETVRLGGDAFGCALDVTDRAGWAAARLRAEERFGPVQILVNNAGLAPDWNELVEMPFEHFDLLVNVMLTGVFNGVRTFGPSMRAAGEGHIVNVSSMVALTGAPRQGAYVAAKAAVVGMSESLFAEMRPHGVGVSVVCPARVRSNLLRDHVPAHLQGDQGMEPGVVAEQVLDAVRSGALYVITHRQHKGLVEARFQRVLASFDGASDGKA